MKSFIVLLFSILTFSVTSCIINFTGIDGNGNIITESRNISSFDRVDVSGAFNIVMQQGESESVSIEGDENLMEYIVIENDGNKLLIDTRENLNPSRDIVITLTFKELSRVEISGACEITNKGLLQFQQIAFDCSGASKCELNMEADNCEFDVSGAGKLELNGKAKHVDFDASGAVDIEADEFEVENCTVDLSGAAEADLLVTKTLELDISGAAKLSYYGNAVVTRQDISGAASISAKQK